MAEAKVRDGESERHSDFWIRNFDRDF
jgi:hypothetical protein